MLVKTTLSPLKNKIELIKVAPTFEKKQTVLLVGVFHGDEYQGEYLLTKLLSDLKSKPELLAENEVFIIPCLNPDGKEKKTRVNINGVDLNRNFPTRNRIENHEKNEYYPGEFPLSEIESKFIADILQEIKPDRILSIHAPYKCVNFDGPAEQIAQEISKLNGYPVEPYIGYPTPGSFGTFAGIEQNIPVITLELPDSDDLKKLWLENKKALNYFISLSNIE